MSMGHCWSAGDPGGSDVTHDGGMHETLDTHLRIHWKMR